MYTLPRGIEDSATGIHSAARQKQCVIDGRRTGPENLGVPSFSATATATATICHHLFSAAASILLPASAACAHKCQNFSFLPTHSLRTTSSFHFHPPTFPTQNQCNCTTPVTHHPPTTRRRTSLSEISCSCFRSHTLLQSCYRPPTPASICPPAKRHPPVPSAVWYNS